MKSKRKRRSGTGEEEWKEKEEEREQEEVEEEEEEWGKVGGGREGRGGGSCTTMKEDLLFHPQVYFFRSTSYKVQIRTNTNTANRILLISFFPQLK